MYTRIFKQNYLTLKDEGAFNCLGADATSHMFRHYVDILRFCILYKRNSETLEFYLTLFECKFEIRTEEAQSV
jgi:hypothetical protein